jgi:hypothetical protein
MFNLTFLTDPAVESSGFVSVVSALCELSIILCTVVLPHMSVITSHGKDCRILTHRDTRINYGNHFKH